MKRMIFSLFSVVMLIAITLPATSPPAVVAQPPLSLECLVSPNPTEVGHETDFLAVASGGVSPYSWLWMIDDVEVATTQNTTYTFATAGNYTVCVNVTDFLGNENQSCMSVTVNPALVMECLVSPNPTKVGHATDFLAAAIGGVPPYSWLWMIDDVEVATTQNTTYTFATAGDYTVCVTVNDSLGNEEKCCTSVTVNPAPNEEYHLFIDVPNKDITITNAEETTWLLIGSVYYGGGHCSNVAADLLVDGSAVESWGQTGCYHNSDTLSAVSLQTIPAGMHTVRFNSAVGDASTYSHLFMGIPVPDGFRNIPNADVLITNAEETTWLLIGSVYYGGGHCSNVAADLLVDGSAVESWGQTGCYHNSDTLSAVSLQTIPAGMHTVRFNSAVGDASTYNHSFVCIPVKQYAITVNTVGSGSVVKNPEQTTYLYGVPVELTATADPGWSFSHWTGDLTGSTNPESIIMTEDKTVTAHFTLDEYTLTANTVGNGVVVKDPDQATYVYNISVQLNANPDTGWSFSHWTGDLTGSTNPESIIMTEDKTVTAHFTPDEYTLTVNTVGNGAVMKEPDQATYTYNTSVQLTANPDTDWSFSHWTGDLTGSTNPNSIIMIEDKTVTAHFSPDEYIKDFTNQDIPVSGTVVSGSHNDTHSNDNISEWIEEAQSPGNSNKSYLEHKWTIDVTGGVAVTFYVEAYHSLNSEGDDFEFSYSTDDQSYTYMLTVNKTAETSGYQTFSLPSSLSGTVYIRVTDTDQTRGNTILDTIYIDHMYIESSPSTDTIPPSEVTNLNTETGDYGQVILTWTATGDDGMIGIASEYDIRYVPQANGPVVTETEWLGATSVTGEPAPSLAGTSESMSVGGLEPGASYYFAIKTADEVPNWSALSNSPLGRAGSAGSVHDFVDQDISVSGKVSGDYTYTHSSDDIYQSITEVKSRGKVKHSYLDHKWTINVTGGDKVVFYVEAYHSPNTESDNFIFAYSLDDVNYINMLNVDKTIDDNTCDIVVLPSYIGGTVYIRVFDTDQTPGNTSLDTIYIDYMFIESERW